MLRVFFGEVLPLECEVFEVSFALCEWVCDDGPMREKREMRLTAISRTHCIVGSNSVTYYTYIATVHPL